MSFQPAKSWTLLAIVALAQVAVLVQIVVARQSLINNGKEVVLAVTPIDPRDLFRGDYVILGYDILRLDLASLQIGDGVDTANRGDTVYVTLVPASDGTWKATAVSMTRPDNSPSEETGGKAIIRGKVGHRLQPPRNAPGKTQLAVRYGIESYFVPEGTGRALEKKVRDQSVRAVVALDSDGTAALKGLEVGGERHLFAPLF